MMTPSNRQRGSAASALVKLIAFAVLIMMLPALLKGCTQQAPRVVSDFVSAATFGIGRAIGAGVSRVGAGISASISDKAGEIGDTVKGLWDATEDADKIKLFCKAMPIEGTDELCEQFSGAVGAATDMRRERIACLWQAANQTGRALQIQNNCAAYRNDPSGLESCLTMQIDEPGLRAQCMASAPGQFWKSRGILKPFCPGDVQGIVCGDEPQQALSDYEYKPEYSNCLLREVETWNGVYDGRTVLSKAKACDKYNPQPPAMGTFQAEAWDQCMEDALKFGLGEAKGSERVRYCEVYYRNPKKWWQFWR